MNKVEQGNEMEDKQLMHRNETADLRELADRLADGDSNAWGEMYLRVSDWVIRFLTQYLKSYDEACDVAQEAFVYTWEKRERLREVKNLKVYFYVLAKFYALKAINRREKATGYAEMVLQDPFEADYSAHDIVIEKETEELLLISLRAMPEQRRRVFEMSRFEGKSNEEIARELGLTRNMVKNHIYRVNKELKEILTLVALFIP